MRAALALPEADQTLEILMTELDPDIMSIFTREECLNAAEATKVCYVIIKCSCFDRQNFNAQAQELTAYGFRFIILDV